MSARITLALAWGLALAAPSAAAALLDSSPNGMTIENSVTVPVDPASAWRALIKEVDLWWPKEHSWWGKEGHFRIEPQAGGCFCETAGAREALHMTVSHVEPGVLLRMLGGLGPLQGMGLHGALEWRFQQVEGGTRITLHYVVGGYTTQDLTKFAPVVDQVQAGQLGGLAAYLTRPK